MQDQVICVRIVMLGCTGVGKTSLCGQFTSHCFCQGIGPTHEIDIFRSLVSIDENAVLVQIDDLFPINHTSLLDPDQEDSENRKVFESIVENRKIQTGKQKNPIYAGKAVDGIMFVFDLANKESFELVEKMLGYVVSKENERASNKHPRKTWKVLIGNKTDLSKNMVKVNEIERTKKRYGVEYYKTSALTGKGVDSAFKFLVRQIFEEKYVGDEVMQKSIDSEFTIEETPQNNFFAWCDCSKRSKKAQVCNLQ